MYKLNQLNDLAISEEAQISERNLNKITIQCALKLLNNMNNIYKPIKADGRFKNPFPTWSKPSFMDLLRFAISHDGSCVPSSKEVLDRELPIVRPDFDLPAGNQMKVTWLGHATLVVQMDGIAFMTDPIFSSRASPSQLVGPKRYRPVPCSLEDLPKELKAVVISHNHYDHCDIKTIKNLNKIYGGKLRWFVPTGLGRLIKQSGHCENVVEMEWWDHHSISVNSKVTVFSTPCQHWSKRSLRDDNQTLWSSYAVVGPTKRFLFCGDTGYCDGFKQIGQILGPFDAAAIPIGAYEPRWLHKPAHVDPEEAVMIHEDVRSNYSIAMHWGTFKLGNEFYLEPPRLLAESLERHQISKSSFVTLKHGETRLAGNI